MPIDNIVILVFKLIAGIHAIQNPQQPISAQRAELYARAAVYYGIQKSVDPFELLALARNESDFDEKAIGPDGLDCGITQTRVTYSRYNCAQLRGSPWIAFSEAARELHAYAESCRGHSDYDRCRLNRYNSGQRYARQGAAGRYYLRVRCFTEAARHRAPIAQQCRRVLTDGEVANLLKTADGNGADRGLISMGSDRPSHPVCILTILRHQPTWAASIWAPEVEWGHVPGLPANQGRSRRQRRTRRRPQRLAHRPMEYIYKNVAARMEQGTRHDGATPGPE